MQNIQHAICKTCKGTLFFLGKQWHHALPSDHRAVPDNDDDKVLEAVKNKMIQARRMNDIPTDADYVRTISLRKINIYLPDIDQIDINDIAYHLAGALRFSGGTRPRLCVAEHCINCFKIGQSLGYDNEILRCLLLHDGEEYVYGDLAAPIKHKCKDYMNYAELLSVAIGMKYKAPFGTYRNIIKDIDYRMCRTENHYLRNNLKEDIYENFRFQCMIPDDAERAFLEAFNACCA